MQYIGTIIGSILIAVGFNYFLIPHGILSSGLSGLSMLIGMITPVEIGVVNFLLNFPLLIIGYLKLGRKFIILTILSVFIVSIGLYLFPAIALVDDIFLSTLYGGAVVGAGIGIVFRSSGSSGGFDIIGMLLARKWDFPIGTLLTAMNACIIFISGRLFDWNIAFYTMASIFVTGKVLDAVFTHHVKLTLMIVTDKGEEVRSHLIEHVYRGVTVMDGVGGYTKEKRNILMTVISRYELNQVKELISEVDPKAFVNITETVEVFGLFNKPAV